MPSNLTSVLASVNAWRILRTMLVGLLSLALTLAQPPHPPRPPDLQGPAVVVLLKDGCPCAQECHVALNALAVVCRGKIKFVGLVDGDVDKARLLRKSAGLNFPVVADPKSLMIRSLRGHEALNLRLLDAQGKPVGGWNGLNRSNVSALVDAVRNHVGADIALDLGPFTELPKIGCAYP